LISQAWDVAYGNILGGPAWIDSQHYDLSAKVEGDGRLTKEQMQPMLRNLLTERLHLSVHREHKIVPGYALVVAKGGVKMKANTGAPFVGMSGGLGFKFQNAPVVQIASVVAHEVKKPVVDETGMSGNYDFEVKFTSENFPSDVPHPDYGSIFTALRDQLGLRLVARKVPQDYLVIDRVERVPDGN
ncbi:MAG TPA: TIGR03435 family protein, partial [Bryobacteraceae bacterium]|nr:TIGR03435 family protein [Bryobacteraceae bacterium]